MLVIEDLKVNEELDRAAMRKVSGGMSRHGVPASFVSAVSARSMNSGLNGLLQGQSLSITPQNSIFGLSSLIPD